MRMAVAILGRQAHLGALLVAAPELLSEPPAIEYTDVVAAELPGQCR
ncbi:hypothetical protein ACQP1G_45465 [Nocardia sp. CA-107356]